MAPTIGEWVTLTHPERVRQYYKNGEMIAAFYNVTRVKISASGNHYIDGDWKGILRPDSWDVIYIDTDEWTF